MLQTDIDMQFKKLEMGKSHCHLGKSHCHLGGISIRIKLFLVKKVDLGEFFLEKTLYQVHLTRRRVLPGSVFPVGKYMFTEPKRGWSYFAWVYIQFQHFCEYI